MIRPDSTPEEYHREPDEQQEACMICGILLYASGFVMGCILTALVLL